MLQHYSQPVLVLVLVDDEVGDIVDDDVGGVVDYYLRSLCWARWVMSE